MSIRKASVVLNRLVWVARFLHSATCHAVCHERRRRHTGQSRIGLGKWSGLENLQSRVLLSANLLGTIDTSKLAAVIVPGDSLSIPIRLSNTGDAPATGKITINLYLSSDQTLDLGTDLLVASLTNQKVNLKVGQAPQTFMAKFTVPSTRPAGSYFLLADIDPGHVASPIDNVAASSAAATLAYEFGNFSGRTNVKLVVGDISGAVDTFSLTGKGSGELQPDGTTFDLVTTGTDTASSISIAAKGGTGQATLDNITVNGSLKGLAAATTNIIGNITFLVSGSNTGVVSTLALRNLGGASLITIPGLSAALTLQGDNFNGVSVNSAEPIKSIAVQTWTGSGQITAPSVGTLTSKVAFNPDLFLSGSGVKAGATALGKVTIGEITGGSWSIGGSGGALTVGSIDPGWSGGFSGNFQSLTATGTMSGELAAAQIGLVNVTGNLSDARFFAGANFGADGLPGGSGANADTFGSGSILGLTVGGTASDVIIAAGLDPQDGILFNGNDTLIGATSAIKALSVKGAVTDSFFVANVLPKSVTLAGLNVAPVPASDPRFQIPNLAVPNATATISAAQLDADTFRYTITLDNTGKLPIGTFWYSWVPDIDFLPVEPTNAVSPTGWTANISGGPSGGVPNGFSIQWTTTSDFLAVGGTSTFQFDSTSTPAQVNGLTPFYTNTPVGRSFVYTGLPADNLGNFDPNGKQIDVAFHPDPASAPILTGGLTNDTGVSSSDGITSNATISGTVTDPDGIASLVAGFGATPNIDISADLSGNTLTLSAAQLATLNGGSLPDGSYTLKVQATDTLDNPSAILSIPFTLDTTPPATPTLDLAAAFDTPPVGDGHTTNATVTLTGHTSPGAQVALVGLNQTVTSDNSGNFSFPNVALTLGGNAFTVQATDAAGNQSSSQKTITRDAVLEASAVMTVQQLSPTDYRYTISLDNTGGTAIGTFWFSWVPGEEFMATPPSNIVSPSGWTPDIVRGAGYSIQWTTSSASLAAGNTLSTFQFDSATTPAQMSGNSIFATGVPVVRSFIYIGAPLTDPGFQLDVTTNFT
jgi:Bacterial Ig-like domain